MKWRETVQGAEAGLKEVKRSVTNKPLEQRLKVMWVQCQSDLYTAAEHCKPENKSIKWLHKGM